VVAKIDHDVKVSYRTKLGRLYQGDCLQIFPAIQSETVDLVFLDPPFNLGHDYGPLYKDRVPRLEYLEWSKSWLRESVRVLKPGGALYLFHLPAMNLELGHYLNELGMFFRQWITVELKLGLPIVGRLSPAHYSLLYYTNGAPRKFTRPRVPIQVCRHCGKDVKDYGGHRHKLHPDGINLSDVWSDIPPVRHRSTKWRSANQLNEKLLERVLTISTEKGDLVMDPFGGSGTTYAVAQRMRRKWIGIEIGDTKGIISRLNGGTPNAPRKNMGDSRKGDRRKVSPQAASVVSSKQATG
jgi:site-specific DNA-methyltransferase (adenine-specific)